MKKSPPRKRNHDGSEPERVHHAVEQPAARGLRIAQFRGPLPPPAALERYDRLLPGAAERILRMAEQEQAAGHRFASDAVGVTAAETKRGQSFGLVAALAALGVTAYLGFLGHAFAASVVGGTTVVGLATVFAIGRRRAPTSRDGPA